MQTGIAFMQIGVQTWKAAGCCLGCTGGRAGDHDLLRFRLLSREGDRFRALRRSREQERDRDLEGEWDLPILAAHCPHSPQRLRTCTVNMWPAHARKVLESKPRHRLQLVQLQLEQSPQEWIGLLGATTVCENDRVCGSQRSDSSGQDTDSSGQDTDRTDRIWE